MLLLICTVSLLFAACKKTDEITQQESSSKKVPQAQTMSDDVSFECYIEDAVSDFPDVERFNTFIGVISQKDGRFNSNNTIEVIVRDYSTSLLTIGYLNEDLQIPSTELPKPLQAMSGKGYYAYVLFNDGWFYFCYILEAADGSYVCIKQPYNDGSSMGFEPIWSGLDMDNVCFFYFKNNAFKMNVQCFV